ncbi:MAG: electron transfer flavoprotein subunit beta/FixA family protein [Cyclobacteriaceae bacterium]
MKILVCISHVPDTTSKIKFTPDKTQLDKNGIQFIIGPYDDYALARAVEIRDANGGTITVLNVGLAETEPTIRKALAIGADDAIRIDAEPVDSFFVASQIATVAKENTYDLIMMGRESIDYNSGLVHGMVGEMLGMPAFSPVMKLDIKDGMAQIAREIEGGKETLEVSLPFVAGCQEPIAEWKIPNMRGIMTARTKPLNVLPAKSVEPLVQHIQYDLPAPKGAVKMVDADNPAELIRLLNEEARVL